MSWLKVEVETPNKPEMDRVMQLCGCSRAEAFFAFFKFYAWADATTDDGFIQFLTPEVVDNRAGMTKFGVALEDVGWLRYSAKGGQIENYERHNGKSAKRRALTAMRMRKMREGDGEGEAPIGAPLKPRGKTFSQAQEDALRDRGAANWIAAPQPSSDPPCRPDGE